MKAVFSFYPPVNSNPIQPKELPLESFVCRHTREAQGWQHLEGNFLSYSSSQTQCLVHGGERVTGRKTRGLQTEEVGCECQTFLISLSGRRRQVLDLFPSPSRSKEASFKALCCHEDTWFHLNVTFLEPGANQRVFLWKCLS